MKTFALNLGLLIICYALVINAQTVVPLSAYLHRDGGAFRVAPSASLEEPSTHQGGRLSLARAYKMHSHAGAEFLDARAAEDFSISTITGARLATKSELLSASQGASNCVLFGYAADDPAVMAAYRLLQAHGIPNVYILDASFSDWQELGLPTAHKNPAR